MKLTTDIPARRDGTLNVKAPSGTTYKLIPDKDGRLTVDVADESDLCWLLDTGNFYPADEANFDTGIKVISEQAFPGTDDLRTVEEVDAQIKADNEAEDTDDGDENAAPIEANTPPKKRGRPAKAK